MRASRVVYTAITNRHAGLSAHPSAPDTDFICYSDVPLDRDDWQVRPIEAPWQLSPRMRAKYHKLFPPEGYAWNVWVDGAYSMRTDEAATHLVDDLIAHSPGGFGLHRHTMRGCLFDEASHSIQLDKCKDQRELIAAQALHYEQRGHPRNWGLWAGGLLCRDTSARVSEIMRRWWDEMQRWSWRDQISLAFVLHSLRTRPDDWPWPLFGNPYMAGWTCNPFDDALG
jgi:hypothetical protein